ncbi:hypothetical protein E2C01_076952 [Portunus trituberculatus]|uniref:Uncharacterized protein n=1 Tax=Portunus trituberculatus TaxID=210409 RepID=A0A5B7IQ06_PORTR|nr:hypothetical protein [Portunus trituberculatus]
MREVPSRITPSHPSAECAVFECKLRPIIRCLQDHYRYLSGMGEQAGREEEERVGKKRRGEEGGGWREGWRQNTTFHSCFLGCVDQYGVQVEVMEDSTPGDLHASPHLDTV